VVVGDAVRAKVDEELGDVVHVVLNGMVQRRVAVVVRGVDIGAILQQQLDRCPRLAPHRVVLRVAQAMHEPMSERDGTRV
jgi:hypothetical protein